VRSAAGRAPPPGLDPATLTFQALRIHVNRELEGLGEALTALASTAGAGRPPGRDRLPQPGGPRGQAGVPRGRGQGFTLLTKKPQGASADETRRNPRSRSARLRALARPEAA
jgi:16S rRNA (cytosine1402-N4)-methyltransferase